MTVALPWVLWVTAAAVAGVIAAHLLSVGDPPTLVLPTARFVPAGARSAVSRARVPRDALLLLLRVLALLAAGLGVAGARCPTSRVPVARLVVLDGDVRDTARAWRRAVDAALADARPLAGVVWRDGPTVVRARPLSAAARDSAGRGFPERGVPRRDTTADDAAARARNAAAPSPDGVRSRGTLAGALLRARLAAPEAARAADSLVLEVLSPLRGDAASAALAAVRTTWPGRVAVQVVDDRAAPPSAVPRVPPPVEVVGGEGDDIVAAAFVAWSAGAPADAPRGPVRVRRAPVTAAPATSAPVSAPRTSAPRTTAPRTATDGELLDAGGALVEWPSGPVMDARDTLGRAAGVVANGVALVAPLVRRPPDAAGADTAARREAIAWFVDGAPAVDETPAGAGCVRRVLFEPPGGDLLLDPSARGLLAALVAPCGARATLGGPGVVSRLVLEPEAAGGTPRALAPRAALLPAAQDVDDPWTSRLLLVTAIALLLLEQWWRRPWRRPAAGTTAATAPAAVRP